MYRISEFSQITKLTVKALRYYDEEGMLTPSYRDPNNSYRYYGDGDFQKARLIAMLKSLDFSIAEMKEILGSCKSTADLSCYLEEKRSRIAENIQRENVLIQKLNLHIKSEKQEAKVMEYKMEIREIEPVTVAAIRYRGRYDDVGKYIGTLYKAVKNNAAGPPLSLYYDAEYKEADADIELCLPIKKAIHGAGITVRKLEAVKAICTTHIGSYNSLNLAYKALLDYANENGLTCKTPSREIYIKGPGMIFKGNENSYETEIIIPFDET